MINNTRTAVGSGMEHPKGSKVAKIAARTKGFELEMDPNGDASKNKASNGSWILVMKDVKKGVNQQKL